jgi:hypothetical protein
MTAELMEVDEGLPHNVPRKPKSRGYGPLGTVPTIVIAIGLVIGLSLMVLRFTFTGLGWFVGLTIVGLLAIWKDHHDRGPLEKGASAVGWWHTKRRGFDLLLPGSLTLIGDYPVPGTGASSILSDGMDIAGSHYAVLTYPQTDHHAVSFRANPDGSALVDEKVVIRQADGFADWLVGLGNEPGLEQAAVTVEIAPDAFPALQREINSRMKDDAPELAKTVLKQILKAFPVGGSTSRATITLTYRSPGDVDKTERKADNGISVFREHLASRLPDILASLTKTGAGPCTLMTGDDIIETVRCAYNPGDRAHFQEIRALGQSVPVMKWHSAGPSGALEHRDCYEHGDGTSIVYDKTGFTNLQVAPRAMKPLLAEPPASVHSIRVTWLFRPVSPAKSGKLAESDHAAAKQRTNSQTKPSARATEDLNSAARTRKLEAKGKGLLNFATIVTVTVLNEGEEQTAKAKRRAVSAIDHLGPAARLMLRVFHGSQASAFAQGIGVLGLVTDSHLTIPTAIRKVD